MQDASINKLDFKKCPICSSKSSFIFTSQHNRNIFECSNKLCGHFFTPILKESQGVCVREDDLEKESDKSLSMFDERNIRLLNLFLNYLSKIKYPIRFVDFGAGDAHISRTFKRELKDKATIFCLEPNPLCKGLYEKYGLIQLKGIDDIPDEINFIYMIEVIEHLDNPISVLRKLRKNLSANGLLFISTPLGTSKEQATNAYETKSHIHFFTKESLNLTLITAGFTPIKYKFHPEMYPKTTNMLKKLIRFIKSQFFKTRVNHLVGITKKN